MKNTKNSTTVKYSDFLINVLIAAYSISGVLWLVLSIKPLFHNKMMLVELDPFGLFGAAVGSGNYFMFTLLKSHYEWYLLAKTILLLFLIFYILFCLKLFIKNIINNPFEKSNGKYLKRTGAMIVFASILMYLLKFLDSLIMSNATILVAIAEFLAVIINPFAVIGIILFLIGDVFAYGARLKQENDLTV